MWPLLIPLISAGVGAVGNFFTGRSQGKAAEKASEQQQQGVREARAYAEPLYAEALRIAAAQHAAGQAGLAPYAQQGGQGLTALTALLGLPRAPAGAVPLGGGVPASPSSAVPLGGGLAPAPTTGIPLSGIGGAAGGMVPAPSRGPFPAELDPARRAPATQSSYVTLRAPTGQTQPVPADQVDFYLARGATRV